MFSKVT